jgi:hypothetical protein
MSTATRESIEAVEAALASLDFTPECEVDKLDRYDVVIKDSKCGKPAAWIGVAPCGHSAYFCADHHCSQKSYMCKVCKRKDMHLATYNWVRLR